MATLIPRNRWDLLLPLSDAAPSVSVTVVIPARDNLAELHQTLSALSLQDYSLDLLEVVVVDDLSDPPIELPQMLDGLRITTVRNRPHEGFGAGMARNTGAARASGEVLLFLDADIVCSPSLVRAHARWHEAAPDAVVTGLIRFADFAGLSNTMVRDLLRAGSLGSVLETRVAGQQEWRDRHFARSCDYTIDAPDLFRSTVGALLSVRRSFFQEVGGFRELGVRGIEDTELGYRLHVGGGLFVVDRTAEAWHQGERTLNTPRAVEIRRVRAPYIEDFLPVDGFRTYERSARYRVPRLAVSFDVAVRPDSAHLAFLDDLGRSFNDIHVWTSSVATTSDHRVLSLEQVDPIDQVAVPYRLHVTEGWRPSPRTVAQLLDWFDHFDIGVLHVLDPNGHSEVAVAWSQRAVARARHYGITNDDAQLVAAGEAFGERWVMAPTAELLRVSADPRREPTA